jgi:hypothetical protein
MRNRGMRIVAIAVVRNVRRVEDASVLDIRN